MVLSEQLLECFPRQRVPGDCVSDGGEDPVEFAQHGPPVTELARYLLKVVQRYLPQIVDGYIKKLIFFFSLQKRKAVEVEEYCRTSAILYGRRETKCTSSSFLEMLFHRINEASHTKVLRSKSTFGPRCPFSFFMTNHLTHQEYKKLMILWSVLIKLFLSVIGFQSTDF